MDNYYNHDQGSYFPMPFQIICGLIGIAGFVLLFESIIFGLIMIAIGVFVIASRCGIEVNFSENKYRDYWGPIIIKFGKWETLPVIEYVSVFRARTSQTVGSRVSTSSFVDEEIQVNLITDHRKRITVFETDSKNKAVGRAWKFSDKLNVGILDATARETEWIKE